MRKRLLKIAAGLILVIFIGGGVFYTITWYGFREEVRGAEFGVTFSMVMARQLGLEPRTVFDAILNDLGASSIRIPVYWNDIEKESGKFDFNEYDYFVQRSAEKGVKLILAVGQKLPRWPECFIPEWAVPFEEREFEEHLSKALREIVMRYRGSIAVERWQIENEPFHTFGAGCAKEKIKADIVDREIALIRSLDSRPVVLTDSGEQGFWPSALRRVEVLGISMYFENWNDILKAVPFPFGPGFYALKRKLFGAFYPEKKIIVSELQAEPWGPSLLPDFDFAFQKRLMNVDEFRRRVAYARRTGFDTFYLWGAEWWYWLSIKKNDSGIWEEAKYLFRNK